VDHTGQQGEFYAVATGENYSFAGAFTVRALTPRPLRHRS
jgi:hypothetical protein